MAINVIKFATLISYLSQRTNKVFCYYDCEEISKMIVDVTAVENAMPVKADPQQVDDLMKWIVEGTHKIEAIKAYRTLTGLGLKESKDAVEKYWKQKPFGVD